MVQDALAEWDLGELDFLFVENVGNLVCPSSYDLGEDQRVVLLSVTEGEDKPLKYPTIFNSADVRITKGDWRLRSSSIGTRRIATFRRYSRGCGSSNSQPKRERAWRNI